MEKNNYALLQETSPDSNRYDVIEEFDHVPTDEDILFYIDDQTTNYCVVKVERAFHLVNAIREGSL